MQPPQILLMLEHFYGTCHKLSPVGAATQSSLEVRNQVTLGATYHVAKSPESSQHTSPGSLAHNALVDNSIDFKPNY